MDRPPEERRPAGTGATRRVAPTEESHHRVVRVLTVPYDPERHHRRSIRLRGHDYAQAGAHFVTICTYQRACLFGEVVDTEMRLSPLGRLVVSEWLRTAEIRPYVDLDAFAVMPNHLHGIIVLTSNASADAVGAIRRIAPGSEIGRPPGPMPGSVGAIISQFKSITTKRAAATQNVPQGSLWQRNYYEHVIRSDASLARLRAYIDDNPARWSIDQLHPDVPSHW